MSGNMQLVYTGKVRKEKDKHGVEREIYETAWREKPRPCKRCRKNQRIEGSKFCGPCAEQVNRQAEAERLTRADGERLKKKIEKQQLKG